MAYPTCSVIIATCDRPDQLRRSIASVIGQTVRPAELIVVDDCSVSPAKSPVAERTGVGFEIRYHRLMERSGASAARNAGARLRARRNYHVPGRRRRHSGSRTRSRPSLACLPGTPKLERYTRACSRWTIPTAAECCTRQPVICQGALGLKFYSETLLDRHRPDGDPSQLSLAFGRFDERLNALQDLSPLD